LSEAKKIRDKYEGIISSEIAALQKTCPHTEFSDWMDERVLGHATGRKVRRCLRCDQVMDVREPPSGKFADPFNVVEREEELEEP
jgi:hypothetical protein